MCAVWIYWLERRRAGGRSKATFYISTKASDTHSHSQFPSSSFICRCRFQNEQVLETFFAPNFTTAVCTFFVSFFDQLVRRPFAVAAAALTNRNQRSWRTNCVRPPARSSPGLSRSLSLSLPLLFLRARPPDGPPRREPPSTCRGKEMRVVVNYETMPVLPFLCVLSIRTLRCHTTI